MVLNTENLKIEELHKENISYSYRYVSGIEKFLIISAKFKFSKGKKEELKKIREEIIRQRKEKQPLDYPSAGSVFKRPKGDYASRLIDICGLKGTRIGGAMVSEKHAGFIINYDNATSTDIYKLILKVKDEVYKKTGISLELEQILVGEF
jgi:UDP-N-acetylmuramate dehydrogenase